MPKKRQKTPFNKPVATSHHSFASSGLGDRQNGRFSSSHTSSSTADQPSVNDLIKHLRRTQVSSKGGTADQLNPVASRSIHPALRNVLEVPETPPPRPRPNTHRTGVGGPRLRPTPGPPPPNSWLLGCSTSGDDDGSGSQQHIVGACTERKIIDRLDRLPGATFPAKNRLLHLALKSMALNWMWHVEYDGQFLGLLPSQIKMLLLSYISIYARSQPLGQLMQGLKPLYQKTAADDNENGEHFYQDTDSETFRLDLGFALGRWMTFKQLTRELVNTSQKPDADSAVDKGKGAVPSSWEDDYADEPASTTTAQAVPKSPSQRLRFENLAFLSLAYPNPAAANWNTLISLMSRLSTLTHLSLAHWPVPTLTPNAMNARIQHPTQSSLSFSYSGTDSYAAFENNWAEAAAVLRKLSRVTYCLKWLDLEGCDWIPALNWEDTSDDGEVYAPGSAGPEWNRSWRDIEHVRLGTGYLPRFDVGELLSPRQVGAGSNLAASLPLDSARRSSSRSLASSVHAPYWRPIVGEEPSSPTQGQSWDVEEERIKYGQAKELERFRESVHSAKAVQNHVLRIRRQGRGKWVHFSFGLEDLEFDDLRKLLGPDYVSVVP